MATIEIIGDRLVLEVTGIDRILALKHTVEVPLSHVAGIDRDAAEAGVFYHGLKLPGTAVPGLVTAGSFLRGGKWTFWDVHDPRRAVIVRLHDEHYSRLVVGVDDPDETVTRVRSALAARQATAG
jgi:hypothetical protein